AGTRLALAFAMQSRSRGICNATGAASNHRFHQPNWRRIISRSGGGVCSINPAISTGLDAARYSAAVTPMLAPYNTIGASAAALFNASNAATAAGQLRANRAGPVLPPNPG